MDSARHDKTSLCIIQREEKSSCIAGSLLVSLQVHSANAILYHSAAASCAGSDGDLHEFCPNSHAVSLVRRIITQRCSVSNILPDAGTQRMESNITPKTPRQGKCLSHLRDITKNTRIPAAACLRGTQKAVSGESTLNVSLGLALAKKLQTPLSKIHHLALIILLVKLGLGLNLPVGNNLDLVDNVLGLANQPN
jgi:hypothetical protein